MDIFGKTAAGFGKEVDSAISTFKSAVEKLRGTAEKASAAKAEKQQEIKLLETECSNLDDVSTKATNMASKIEALFS